MSFFAALKSQQFVAKVVWPFDLSNACLTASFLRDQMVSNFGLPLDVDNRSFRFPFLRDSLAFVIPCKEKEINL